MILEGIITTRNADGGGINVSPMGPILPNGTMDHFLLRPFQTSRTYLNLKAHREGVLHVTDDVELIARAAIDRLETMPVMVAAHRVQCDALADACRWYEFQVTELDDSDERTTIHCTVVHENRVRDFFGFNRAKHAVLEAAILATRVHFLPIDEITIQLTQLRVLVEKTGGRQEHAAFDLLASYVAEHVEASES